MVARDFIDSDFSYKKGWGEMKVLKREIKLCPICMEEHEVQTVKLLDTEKFRGVEVEFQSVYEYCERADQLLEDEEMIRANSLAMKDAYRNAQGLFTPQEIAEMRKNCNPTPASETSIKYLDLIEK